MCNSSNNLPEPTFNGVRRTQKEAQSHFHWYMKTKSSSIFYNPDDYVNMKTPIDCQCTIDQHKWSVIPSSLKEGSGCPKCAGLYKTTEDFIAESRMVFGESFDYSETVYVDSTTKVSIRCGAGHVFSQIPSNHLNNNGCPECSRQYRSTEEFIVLANDVHDDTFDYSTVDYYNAHTKVIIKCNNNHTFKQTPMAHLNGQGCPYCAGYNRTTETFIKEADIVHKISFDYTNVVFINVNQHVNIVCPIGHSFHQTPRNHLQGHGCPTCVGRNKTTQDFIGFSISVHGDKYDYAETEYKGAHQNVKITCGCGNGFWQSAASHMNGSGCSACAGYGFDATKPAILYYLKIIANGKTYYKIGITNRSVKERMSAQDNYTILEQWNFEWGEDARFWESKTKSLYNSYRTKDRGFLTKGGETECFEINVLVA